MSLEESIINAIRRATTLDELALTLEHLIDGGFAVWSDGSLYETRQLVGRARGLRIEIYPREHPPPTVPQRSPPYLHPYLVFAPCNSAVIDCP